MPPAPEPRLIHPADLAALAPLVGCDYRTPAGAAVAQGRWELAVLRPGLVLHASDVRHLRPLASELTKPQGLTLSVVLRGRWQALLGGAELGCGGRVPEAMLFACAHPERWAREALPGQQVRMVNLMLGPEWLDAEEVPQHLWCQHLAQAKWAPSAHLCSLAEAMLAPEAAPPLARRLRTESHALAMLAEALPRFDTPAPSGLVSATMRRQMQRARERIEAGLAEPLSIAALARELGLSSRGLQRHFHAVHGVPVARFLRDQRLQHARRLLEREGMGVAQVAYAVGYASPANFATAYRRRFGVSPSQSRPRAEVEVEVEAGVC